MGASICAAAKLEELICRSEDEYVAKAISLGLNSAALAGVRKRLLQGRDTVPLFDVVRFTRELEGAFVRMVSGEV
jgi:predicted O-linked N-acetylglucosamine transferase (SPINDLY family)